MSVTLDEQTIKDILKVFPKFELCYETIVHKKVLDADFVLAMPQGKTYFAWFTVYKYVETCFLLEIDKNNKSILDVRQVQLSFSSDLAKGTVLYGTIFHKDVQCFCIEDVYYYCGKYCSNMPYNKKLELMISMFSNNLLQSAVTNDSVIFGLPFIAADFLTAIKGIPLLSYEVDSFVFRFPIAKKINRMKYIPKNSVEHKTREAIFNVKPDIVSDIYHLYLENDEYYDIAFVAEYKTSVMMNTLFRNIKENSNLDLVEASDDEEEFQDCRKDKYVYLDRQYKMKCVYNHKFKRWTPVCLAGENDTIIPRNMLKRNIKSHNNI